MTKLPEVNNKDLQKRLEEIIDRTKAQNSLLNKLLEEIEKDKPVSKKINKNQ